MALASGTRLGAYEIVDALGAGGMGEVYRARVIGRVPYTVTADGQRFLVMEPEAAERSRVKLQSSSSSIAQRPWESSKSEV